MRNQAFALFAAAAWACGGSPNPEPPAGSDSAAVDSAARESIVVLRTGPLHLEPEVASPGITDVAAGTLLRVVGDSGEAEGWVRVATWDDRRGWIPAERLVSTTLWAHYAQALGGVSPGSLRPAYPVDGGRWGVEAPTGSPGITSASTAWLVGDTTESVRVTAIDSVENICGGELHRFGILEGRAGGSVWPLLEVGRIAAPSGGRPVTRTVPVGPLDPDSTLVRLAREAAAELAPGAGPPESTAWLSLGPDAAWSAMSWPFEGQAEGISQRAAAVVFRRAGSGWERAASIAPTRSTAMIPTAAWRPVAAYSTGAQHPTLLLLEAREYEGAHLDLWIDRGEGYVRIYEGYYWGC